ncbi:hypothetical protein M9H77_34679 [Catharanthus roseus]|uniref:Uncharacterized protein n=1 Tax=Catharanthus roseus TaxID=4058 RepID=A0ACB9ZNK2_CATRO|nr:hypothetical protein M9H77_34679 [Catharanthus roseus]
MPINTALLPPSSSLGPVSSSLVGPSQVLAGSDPLVNPTSTIAFIEPTTIGPQEGQPSLVSPPVFDSVENSTMRCSQHSHRPSHVKDYLCNTIIHCFIYFCLTGKKIEKYHTGTGIPRPYPGPWRVGFGSKILYPGGYESGSGSKFNYKCTGLGLEVP